MSLLYSEVSPLFLYLSFPPNISIVLLLHSSQCWRPQCDTCLPVVPRFCAVKSLCCLVVPHLTYTSHELILKKKKASSSTKGPHSVPFVFDSNRLLVQVEKLPGSVPFGYVRPRVSTPNQSLPGLFVSSKVRTLFLFFKKIF